MASFLPIVSQLSEELDPHMIAAAALQMAYDHIRPSWMRVDQPSEDPVYEEERRPRRYNNNNGGGGSYRGNGGGNGGGSSVPKSKPVKRGKTSGAVH
jgi:ATP-dependent RNA helicase DeaD